MRRIPVLKNGVDVGFTGLVEGDIISIEATHLLPVAPGLSEIVLAYYLFSFKELKRIQGHLFISGDGFHINEDSPDYNSARVCAISCQSIRRICIFCGDFERSTTKIMLDLMKRNEELAQENVELSAANARLLVSHFNSSHLTH